MGIGCGFPHLKVDPIYMGEISSHPMGPRMGIDKDKNRDREGNSIPKQELRQTQRWEQEQLCPNSPSHPHQFFL